MAKTLIKNAWISVGGYVFGSRANSVTIDASAEMVEVTGFGDEYRTFKKSVGAWSLSVGFYDDMGENELNQKLFEWWSSPDPVVVRVKAKNDDASPSNPEWTGEVFVADLPLFNGSLGQASGGSVTLPGNGSLYRIVGDIPPGFDVLTLNGEPLTLGNEPLMIGSD